MQGLKDTGAVVERPCGPDGGAGKGIGGHASPGYPPHNDSPRRDHRAEEVYPEEPEHPPPTPSLHSAGKEETAKPEPEAPSSRRHSLHRPIQPTPPVLVGEGASQEAGPNRVLHWIDISGRWRSSGFGAAAHGNAALLYYGCPTSIRQPGASLESRHLAGGGSRDRAPSTFFGRRPPLAKPIDPRDNGGCVRRRPL